MKNREFETKFRIMRNRREKIVRMLVIDERFYYFN